MPDAACLSVPTESSPGTAGLPLSSSAMPWSNFSHKGGVCSAESSWLWRPHESPAERLSHHCPGVLFSTAKGRFGGCHRPALTGSRRCGCSQAPVAGISLKPPRCKPAWHSSLCSAWLPQSDLVAFQPFSFLPSVAAPLTSVLFRYVETKVITCETQQLSLNSNHSRPLCKCGFWQMPGPSCWLNYSCSLEGTMPIPNTPCNDLTLSSCLFFPFTPAIWIFARARTWHTILYCPGVW